MALDGVRWRSMAFDCVPFRCVRLRSVRLHSIPFDCIVLRVAARVLRALSIALMKETNAIRFQSSVVRSDD
jgi:hypothetical protein